MASKSGTRSPSGTSAESRKRSLVSRLLRPFEVAIELGAVLFTRPRDFPNALGLAFRRGFRAVWDARGGGLYAVGFFVTFLWFELTMFVGDVAEANGVGEFVTSQFFEVLLRFTFESMGNTLRAFLWPLYAVQFSPPVGLALMALAFILFPRFVKPSLERWLFDDEPAAEIENDEKSQ